LLFYVNSSIFGTSNGQIKNRMKMAKLENVYVGGLLATKRR